MCCYCRVWPADPSDDSMHHGMRPPRPDVARQPRRPDDHSAAAVRVHGQRGRIRLGQGVQALRGQGLEGERAFVYTLCIVSYIILTLHTYILLLTAQHSSDGLPVPRPHRLALPLHQRVRHSERVLHRYPYYLPTGRHRALVRGLNATHIRGLILRVCIYVCVCVG